MEVTITFRYRLSLAYMTAYTTVNEKIDFLVVLNAV